MRALSVIPPGKESCLFNDKDTAFKTISNTKPWIDNDFICDSKFLYFHSGSSLSRDLTCRIQGWKRPISCWHLFSQSILTFRVLWEDCSLGLLTTPAAIVGKWWNLLCGSDRALNVLASTLSDKPDEIHVSDFITGKLNQCHGMSGKGKTFVYSRCLQSYWYAAALLTLFNHRQTGRIALSAPLMIIVRPVFS